MANKHKNTDFHFYFAVDPGSYARYNGLFKSADILVSIAYLKSAKRLETFVESIQKSHKGRVILDSGAYTNFAKPGFITFDEWTAFVKSHGKWLTEYIQFDDLRSRQNTVKFFEKAAKAGLDPLFVDQIQFDHEKRIEPIWKSHDKVALAGVRKARFGTSSHDKFTAAIERADSNDTYVHLLGVGPMRKYLPMINRINSVDSASWARDGSWGLFRAFQEAEINGVKVPGLKAYSAPDSKVQRLPLPADVKKQAWSAVVAANGLAKAPSSDRKLMVSIVNTKRYIEALKKFDPAPLIEAMGSKGGDAIKKMLDDESLGEYKVVKFDPRDESSPDVGWTVGEKAIKPPEDSDYEDEPNTPPKKVAKQKKQADPFSKAPDEEGTYRFVAQHHWRGKSVHSDIRMETVKNKLLIGWTLNTQIADVVKKPVTTLAQAKGWDERMGELSKIDWSTGEWATRERPGADKPVRVAINSQRKEAHPFAWLDVEGKTKDPEAGKPTPIGGTKEFPGVFHILDEGEVEFGVQKPFFHEYFVKGEKLNYRLVFRQAVLGALEKARYSYHHCMRCEKAAPKVDVLWADGRGRAWFCAKCFPLWKKQTGDMAEIVGTKKIVGPKALSNYNDVHKAALPSTTAEVHPVLLEILKRVLPPSVPQGDTPSGGESTWLAMRPDDQTPNVISAGAVDKGFMPPGGMSALPKAVRTQVPEEFRYWGKSDEADARKTRDALVEAIKVGAVKLDFDAPFKAATKKSSEGHEQTEPTEKRAFVDFGVNIPIHKLDKERRLVVGVVLEPGEVDAQKDTVAADVIEKAAGDFLASFNRETELGLMHKKFGDVGLELRESWIAPVSMKIGGKKVKKGTWIMKMKIVKESLWELVKAGKITGFSIGGVATTRSKG